MLSHDWANKLAPRSSKHCQNRAVPSYTRILARQTSEAAANSAQFSRPQTHGLFR